MEKLRAESSILDFDFQGEPPNRYRVSFRGAGFMRDDQTGNVYISDRHEVVIDLNAAYPRMIPDLAWQTPIFHPNISASGVVCLGGYSTHWAPSLTLDELCIMLWDMIRFKNFDTESPYNREAAIWTKSTEIDYPIDHRPLRDRVSSNAGAGTSANVSSVPTSSGKSDKPPTADDRGVAHSASSSSVQQPRVELADVMFIEPNDSPIVDAEVIGPDDGDILFIE